jgi:rhodanese-related sulfurtransferase
VRDAALIAIVGIGLGLSYNQALVLAHDDRALTWVAKERSTGVLELATPAAASGDASTPAASSSAPSSDASTPAASSSAPAASSTTAATTPASETKPAAHDTTHAKKSSAKKSAKAAPASAKAAPTSASPAHGPIETSEGGAKSAAPASAPASGGPSNPAATAAGGAAAANVPAIPDTREPMEANYSVIKALHDANGALFLDARSAEEYAAGHIPGAISMPFDDVFKKPDLAKNLDDKGKPIVTYCDGGDCELSKDLAFSLIDNGHKKVVFFKDGLPGWKSAGNPVNTGSQP